MRSLTILTIKAALTLITYQTLQVVARKNSWDDEDGFNGHILGDSDDQHLSPTPAPEFGLHGNLWGSDMGIAPRRLALGSGVYNALIERAVISFLPLLKTP